jgi:hypothetical protein
MLFYNHHAFAAYFGVLHLPSFKWSPYLKAMETIRNNFDNNIDNNIQNKLNPRGKQTKKSRIYEAWLAGERDIRHLAFDLNSTPSYVASVLQQAHLIEGYYDLYTSSQKPLNIYVQDLDEKIGFKDIAAAQHGVAKLEEGYHGLGEMKDRAGQHHFMVLALTMFNRARFSGKLAEANLYRDWLMKHLMEEPRQLRSSGI